MRACLPSGAWREFDAKFLEPRTYSGNEEDSWRVRRTYRNQDELRLIARPGAAAGKRIRTGPSGKVKILGNRTHLEIWNPETLEQLEQQGEGRPA